MTGPLRARKRLVLCMGEFCSQGGRAAALYERLQERLGDPVPGYMATGPVAWEVASCLEMCGGGPNLIIYPDDIIYNQLDVATLDRVLTELLGAPAR
jgi:(2Fe-2S) ferredoxin